MTAGVRALLRPAATARAGTPAAAALRVSWEPMDLAGWGRTSRARSLVCRPACVEEAVAALAEAGEEGVLVHAGGRSYGDAALNHGGRAILTSRLDRIVRFDEATGEVVVEPGVSFRVLMEMFLPQGFLVPVSPGTAFATVGGAIASDVHGKSHESAGSFGDHVSWFDLALPSGEVRRVSVREDAELFRATIGGIGLTGLIGRVCFRLRRVPCAMVEVTERRLPDLDAFMSAFEACRRRATFSVGWIDGMARGRRLGRGILETAEFAPGAPSPASGRRPRAMPFDLPSGVLNSWSIRLFNALYFHRVPATGRRRLVPIEDFLYPLDAILHWNRIYGRRGFYQFQCVIPDDRAATGLRALMEAISAARLGSFLAVLKTLGSPGRGYLSFPRQGYTLALDFPKTSEAAALLRRLEAITLEHAGRIYLAKDALLSPDGFRLMYPELPEFRAVLDRIDPSRRFTSDMARRLAIRG